MIYGDMLCFFSEQSRHFDYFTMKPQPIASYSPREDLGKVRGIFQYMKRGELKLENDTLADTNVPTFWTREKLNVGNYFLSIYGEDYRIVNPANWQYEGGFNIYVLATVVGNTDKQTEDTSVNLGQGSYD